MLLRLAMPPPEVSSHLLVQVVILQQPVQLGEHGIDVCCQLGHLSKDVFAGVAVH